MPTQCQDALPLFIMFCANSAVEGIQSSRVAAQLSRGGSPAEGVRRGY